MKLACHAHQVMQPISLQKRLLFATKLFRWQKNAIGKTSFFDGIFVSSTITCRILKHMWRKNEFVENAYYFCWKYDFFGREFFPPYFLQRNKIFVTNKLLFMTTEEKLLELLTLMTAFVRQKYKIYIFYGVIICNKHSSIINIKKGIIYDDLRKTIRTINTCDGFCTLKIQNIYFLWCYYLRQTFFHHKYKRGY